MKKLNYKWVLILFFVLVIIVGSYYGIYAYSHESLQRIHYTLRDSEIFLNFLGIASLFIPWVIPVLYIIFRRNLKDKLNVENIFSAIMVFVILYIIVGGMGNAIVRALLEEGVLGFCASSLERQYNFMFGSCFLSGLEYDLMMYYIFIPLFFILVWELLVYIYKKYFKKNKLKLYDFICLLVIFIGVCLLIGVVIYVMSLF